MPAQPMTLEQAVAFNDERTNEVLHELQFLLQQRRELREEMQIAHDIDIVSGLTEEPFGKVRIGDACRWSVHGVTHSGTVESFHNPDSLRDCHTFGIRSGNDFVRISHHWPTLEFIMPHMND
jgi:hypothetical protein